MRDFKRGDVVLCTEFYTAKEPFKEYLGIVYKIFRDYIEVRITSYGKDVLLIFSKTDCKILFPDFNK